MTDAIIGMTDAMGQILMWGISVFYILYFSSMHVINTYKDAKFGFIENYQTKHYKVLMEMK